MSAARRVGRRPSKIIAAGGGVPVCGSEGRSDITIDLQLDVVWIQLHKPNYYAMHLHLSVQLTF